MQPSRFFTAAALALALPFVSLPGEAGADGIDLSPASVARTSTLSVESGQPRGEPRRLARHQRLRIAGWTLTATGSVLFLAGLGTSVGADCGYAPPCHEDDELFRNIMGANLMGVGAIVAGLVGMPLLVTARVKKKRIEREVSFVPSLGGATLRGTF
ncbi:MAG: hypothetical protein AAF997_02185 [Myxococcota bacterium]